MAVDDDIHKLLQAQAFRDAFELLLERYRDRVFRLACSYLRDETAAEDLAQEVFLRIWKALNGFTGQASLSTWIYTITRNACLTALKRRRPSVSLSDPDTSAALESLPEFQTRETTGTATMDVDRILSDLPERYRQVITLYYLEQKSYEETAAMLAIPVGTVKTFLHRARKELARLAQQHENPVPC